MADLIDNTRSESDKLLENGKRLDLEKCQRMLLQVKALFLSIVDEPKSLSSKQKKDRASEKVVHTVADIHKIELALRNLDNCLNATNTFHVNAKIGFPQASGKKMDVVRFTKFFEELEISESGISSLKVSVDEGVSSENHGIFSGLFPPSRPAINLDFFIKRKGIASEVKDAIMADFSSTVKVECTWDELVVVFEPDLRTVMKQSSDLKLLRAMHDEPCSTATAPFPDAPYMPSLTLLSRQADLAPEVPSPLLSPCIFHQSIQMIRLACFIFC